MKLKFAAGLIALLPLCACDSKKSDGTAATSGSAAAVPAVDPKQRFANDLNALADEVSTIMKNAGGNPLAAAKEAMGVAAKLDNVSTAGLPEDLAAAFAAVQVQNRETMEVMKQLPADMPTDPAAMQEWVTKNPDAMKTMMEMQTKMPAIQAESEAAGQQLQTVAATHGLDLTKFINAGKPGQ